MTGRSVDPHVALLPASARAFQGSRAGVVSRTAAAAIDFVVLTAVLAGTYLSVSAALFLWDTRDFSFPHLTFGVVIVVGSVVLTIYLTLAWTYTGRTYGDHVLGLRVVDRREQRLPFRLALARALFCVYVPIGLFWAAVNRHSRSVQDIVLRTSVVYDWHVPHLDDV